MIRVVATMATTILRNTWSSVADGGAAAAILVAMMARIGAMRSCGIDMEKSLEPASGRINPVTAAVISAMLMPYARWPERSPEKIMAANDTDATMVSAPVNTPE